jgi:hypothetical protein
MDESTRKEFEEIGYVRLPGLIDGRSAERMNDLVWEALNTLHGIERDKPKTWANRWAGLNEYKSHAVFNAINESSLCEEIDTLLGEGNWEHPDQWGGFLIKFPNTSPDHWTVPSSLWHTDFHYTNDPDSLFGVRVFVYLSDVPRSGGGTVVVRSSHNLVGQFVRGLDEQERTQKMSVVRDRFNMSHPWLQRLTNTEDEGADRVQYFMEEEHIIENVSVRVCELLGRCGDVYLLHPWLVHAPSKNAGNGPRFMRAKDVFRLYDKEAELPRTESEI